MSTKGKIGLLLVMSVLAGWAPGGHAADESGPGDEIGRTPPRLSFTDGQVSFWRPGAQDWAPAQVNTPLAPGDELYTGAPGNLEVQIGAQAFVRAWADTQLGLGSQDDAFLQFRVTAGHVALDIRTLEPGRTIEIGTPGAAFTIDRPGYYRADVDDARLTLSVRRAGAALVTSAGGQVYTVGAGQEIAVDGTAGARVASRPAPPPDVWDQWNDARTDRLVETASARFVAPGVYGVSDLDRHGTWRPVQTYGSVWVPAGVPAGWAPYSTGAWTLDPYYGWTWVDAAPWGWAPYHYGRWVFVDGYWAWAPGPPVRPAYAPALVAFYGGPAIAVPGGGPVGWVALGWGEPVVPWWGRPGFARVPWWGGWGGPRVVNNVVVTRTTVVNVQQINVYRNAGVQHAVVVVDRDRFGRGPITGQRDHRVDVKTLQPTHGAPQVAAVPASFVPAPGHGVRPPEKDLKRPVIVTRPVSGSPAEGARRPTRPETTAPVATAEPDRPGPGQKKASEPRMTGQPNRPQADEVRRPPVPHSGAAGPSRGGQVLTAPPAQPVVSPSRPPVAVQDPQDPPRPGSGKKSQADMRGGQIPPPVQPGVGARPPAPVPVVTQTPPRPGHRDTLPTLPGAPAAAAPSRPDAAQFPGPNHGKAKLTGNPAAPEQLRQPGPRPAEIKRVPTAERPAPSQDQGANPESRTKDRRNG